MLSNVSGSSVPFQPLSNNPPSQDASIPLGSVRGQQHNPSSELPLFTTSSPHPQSLRRTSNQKVGTYVVGGVVSALCFVAGFGLGDRVGYTQGLSDASAVRTPIPPSATQPSGEAPNPAFSQGSGGTGASISALPSATQSSAAQGSGIAGPSAFPALSSAIAGLSSYAMETGNPTATVSLDALD
jgi:hypothetical protein